MKTSTAAHCVPKKQSHPLNYRTVILEREVNGEEIANQFSAALTHVFESAAKLQPQEAINGCERVLVLLGAVRTHNPKALREAKLGGKAFDLCLKRRLARIAELDPASRPMQYQAQSRLALRFALTGLTVFLELIEDLITVLQGPLPGLVRQKVTSNLRVVKRDV